MRLTPHFVVPNAADAPGASTRAFDARVRSRVPLPAGKDMALAHQIGESIVHVTSESPDAGILSPLSIGGTATVPQLDIKDAEGLLRQAVAAQATVKHELAEQFWGDRHGQLTDPFGHSRNIAECVRQAPNDELDRAAAEAFGGS